MLQQTLIRIFKLVGEDTNKGGFLNLLVKTPAREDLQTPAKGVNWMLIYRKYRYNQLSFLTKYD